MSDRTGTDRPACSGASITCRSSGRRPDAPAPTLDARGKGRWSLSCRTRKCPDLLMATAVAPSVEVRCPSCGRNRVPASAAGTPRCGACKAPLPWSVSAGDDTFDAVAVWSPLPVLVTCGPRGAGRVGWSRLRWSSSPWGWPAVSRSSRWT